MDVVGTVVADAVVDVVGTVVVVATIGIAVGAVHIFDIKFLYLFMRCDS